MCVTAAALGAPVAALVQRCGSPARVASLDDGAHFTFRDGGATVDAIVDPDRNLVRALGFSARAPETVTVDVDGAPRTFAFDVFALSDADAQLADVAEYAGGMERAYRPSTTRELVLRFDPVTRKLAQLFVGDGATLSRLAAIPRPPGKPAFPYEAPVLKHTAFAGASGVETTIVRVDVDRYGIVRNVAVVVPSGDAAFDAALGARLGDDRYAPARLAGRPIAGSAFRELRH